MMRPPLHSSPIRPAPPRILALSSGGGHWLQLCRLAPAWDGLDVVTACTVDGPPMPCAVRQHHQLPDATRWDRIALLRLTLKLGRLIWRERPTVIITTGAAPGLLALCWGRITGAHTVWIDSLANVEELSGAGRLARWVAHEWLTQWPHLARSNQTWRRQGPRYHGAVW